MNREILASMDASEYQKMLESSIFDGISVVLSASKGHADELHVAMSDKEILRRIATDKPEKVSTFNDSETMEEVLSDVLYYKAKDIGVWMTSGRSEFKNPRDFHTMAFSVDMGGDPIGHGFSLDGKSCTKKETTAVRIVLQRDFDCLSPYGFYIKTAFPDLMHPASEPTGVEFSVGDVVRGDNIPLDDKWEKLYFATKMEVPGVDVRLNSISGKQSMTVTHSLSDTEQIRTYVNEDSVKFKHLDDKGAHWMKYGDFFFSHPDVAADVSKIKNLKDSIDRGEMVHEQSGHNHLMQLEDVIFGNR